MIGGRASPADEELMRLESSKKRGSQSQVKSVSHSVSFVAAPRAYYTTVSTDGSAPLGQHKY